MENPIKMDDLGRGTPIFGNTHMELCHMYFADLRRKYPGLILFLGALNDCNSKRLHIDTFQGFTSSRFFVVSNCYLGCGFKYFYFYPLPGEMILFDDLFLSYGLKPRARDVI